MAFQHVESVLILILFPTGFQIGINLADPVFRGRYYGVQRHTDDLSDIMKRALETGCTKMIVTGSDFKSIKGGLDLAAEYRAYIILMIIMFPTH